MRRAALSLSMLTDDESPKKRARTFPLDKEAQARGRRI